MPLRSSTVAFDRLLIVEDHPTTCKLYRTVFQEISTLDIAYTASRGLAKAHSNTYDMALLDIHLAGSEMSGTALLQEIRRFRGAAELPIVAVTSYAMRGDREEFLACGFDSYLAKPFTIAQLLEQMIAALQVTNP